MRKTALILLLTVFAIACNVAKPSLIRKIDTSKFSIEITYFEKVSFTPKPDATDFLSNGKYVILIKNNTEAKRFTFSAPRYHLPFIKVTQPAEKAFFIQSPKTLIISTNSGQNWETIPFEELSKKFRPNCFYKDYSVKATKIFVAFDCANYIALRIYSEDFGQSWRLK
jgi:hypothetical protein